MGSRGLPYASGGPHCRGFPYGTLREFLVDTQMLNVCYTMARLKKNEINRKYPLHFFLPVIY